MQWIHARMNLERNKAGKDKMGQNIEGLCNIQISFGFTPGVKGSPYIIFIKSELHLGDRYGKNNVHGEEFQECLGRQC